MEYVQWILSICGAISIVGGAGAIIAKVVRPAFKFNKRVKELEEHDKRDYNKLVTIENTLALQTECFVAMLNHYIDGNGIESMKAVREELLSSIIVKSKDKKDK